MINIVYFGCMSIPHFLIFAAENIPLHQSHDKNIYASSYIPAEFLSCILYNMQHQSVYGVPRPDYIKTVIRNGTNHKHQVVESSCWMKPHLCSRHRHHSWMISQIVLILTKIYVSIINHALIAEISTTANN